jgi:tetratricopeptide (TPR) repeat protein
MIVAEFPGSRIISAHLANAFDNLADLLKAAGREQEAADVHLRLVKLSPNNAILLNETAWDIVASANAQPRHVEWAVEYAQQQIKVSPTEYGYWSMLGMAQYRAGRWNDSIAALEESCRLESSTNGIGNAWQWLFLAMAHWQSGNRDEAVHWYLRSVDHESNWPDLLRRYRAEADALMGDAVSPPRLQQLRQSRWDEELTKLTQVVEQHPGDPHALAPRAAWLLAHGRFAEADLDLKQLLQLQPDDHWHWYYRACLLAYLGNEREYREHCRAMLDRFPDPTDGPTLDKFTKSALLLPDGAADDVQELALRAERAMVDLGPNPWSTLLLGLAEIRAGRYAKAIESLEKCGAAPADGCPARVVAANAYAAIALFHEGRPQESQVYLDRATHQAKHDLPQLDSGKLNSGGVENWLIAQIALREATMTVSGETDDDSCNLYWIEVRRAAPENISGDPSD